MARQRLHHLDVLRAIAFVMVVIQHTLGGYSYIPGIRRSEYLIMKFFYALAKPAVPIFLMISAIALMHTYTAKFSLKDYYSKRIKFVVIPYVVWSVINMLKMGNPDRLSNLPLQLLAGNGAYHFWYMGMIIRLYFWFPIVLWLAKNIHRQPWVVRAMVGAGSLWAYFLLNTYQTTILGSAAGLIFGHPTALQQKIVDISPICWFPYFILGVYISMNYQLATELINRYCWVIVTVFLSTFSYAYLFELHVVGYVHVLYLTYTVVTMLFMYLLSSWLANIQRVYTAGRFISDYSYAAYMAHVIVIQSVSNTIILRIGNGSYLVVGLLTLIITLAFTPTLIWAMGLIPFHEYLTGTRNGLHPQVVMPGLDGLLDAMTMD